MDPQDKKTEERLWHNKVMGLHQAIERALSRQWILLDDRHYREKAPINRALKRVKHLNILVKDGLVGSESYHQKLKNLMQTMEEIGLYDFVSEEVLQSFGSETGVSYTEDAMASTFAWIRNQGIDL